MTTSSFLKPRASAGLVLALSAALIITAGCGGKKNEQQESAAPADLVKPEATQVLPPTMPGMIKTEAKPGDKVKVLYRGTLDNGTVFDESNPDTPLEFVVGSKEIIPGFSKGVTDMKVNEEKSFKIPVEEAYGKRDETLIKRFPKSSLPKDMKVAKGMTLGLQDQTGRQMPGTIVDVTDSEVAIDMNHPLAGNNLNFKIKLLSIQ